VSDARTYGGVLVKALIQLSCGRPKKAMLMMTLASVSESTLPCEQRNS